MNLKQLIDHDYGYSLKFYNDNNYYKVYSTESVKDSSFTIKVLNDQNWSNNNQLIKKLKISDDPKNKNRSIIDINYSDLQTVAFKNADNPSKGIKKKLSFYSIILAIAVLMITQILWMP